MLTQAHTAVRRRTPRSSSSRVATQISNPDRQGLVHGKTRIERIRKRSKSKLMKQMALLVAKNKVTRVTKQ